MDPLDPAQPGSHNLIIRNLRPDDLERIVRIDEEYVGRRRQKWFEDKLARALSGSALRVSLGAEIDGLLVGALLGDMQYGEFGVPEPVAVLDTVVVDPAFRRQRVGAAMLQQMVKNLAALRVTSIRTEVAWDELDLLGWFNNAGFRPVPRLVLELPVQSD